MPKSDNTVFYLTNEDVRNNCLLHINDLPEDVVYKVDIREDKETRSGKQNRLMWLWLREIIQYARKSGEFDMNVDEADMKQWFCERVFGVSTVVIGGKEIRKYHSTSGFSVDKMAKLLEMMDMVSAQRGLILPSPQDLKIDLQGRHS